MQGYMLNPDTDYVKVIIQGIKKRNGHCPCRIMADDTTLCPCDEFVKTGKCKCRLFIKKDAIQVQKTDENKEPLPSKNT